MLPEREAMIALTPKEREFVLTRLDREHIADVAARVRAQLNAGAAVEACYMPGDGTWYALVFTPLGLLVGGLGGGTNGNAPHTLFPGSTLLVAYGQNGTLVDLYPNCDLEERAARLTSSASALAIAELLRAVTG